METSNANLQLSIVLLLVSVLCVAFFNSSEASLISVNKIRIRHRAEGGSRAAQSVQRILSIPDRLFATISIMVNLFIILATSVGTALTFQLLGNEETSVLVATVGMTVLVLLFGEITPKTLALQTAERYSLLVAHGIEAVIKLLTPFVYLFTLTPNLLLRGIGRRQARIPFVTEAEIRMLIDIGEEEGTVTPTEGEMLDKVFHFKHRYVKDVMTPRPDMVWVEAGSRFSEFLATFQTTPHSRFPVYRDSVDNVVGILGIKDVLMAQASGSQYPEATIDSFVRPAYFVPETKPIGQLFADMQAEGIQVAIIVDEFGGTAGMVTIEQLLEEIVGQIGDELTKGGREVQTIDEKTVEIDGNMRIDEANKELNLHLPPGDYETVAGFLLHLLGHIPTKGEQVRYDNLRLMVTEMEGVKIERILVAHE